MDAKSGVSKIRYMGLAEAAYKVSKSERILVIGCSGGGKSTLSRRIAGRFGLEFISMDRDVFWLPGWVPRGKADQIERIKTLVSRDRWIMDGTNTSTFDIRVPRSDLVIWVRMPRRVCVWGIISRWIRNRGGTRPEMAVGCVEKIDLEFIRFVWTWEKVAGPRVLSGLEKHAGDRPVLVLRSRGEMRRLLDLLGA